MIDDFNIRSDDDTFEFVSYMSELIKSGETLYIHCLGGHGRTATISAPLLVQLYGID
jgi:protein-tyrosine phosphatase